MSNAWGCLAAALIMSGCGFGMVATGETRRETMSLDLDKSASVRASIRMSAGELRVQGGSPKLLNATFNYNVPDWKPVIDYRPGDLSISQPSHSGSAFGNTVNEWELTLNNEVPFDFMASLGAGEATLNLGRMNLGHVEVSIGAGEVTMDLRGEPRRDYTVQIRGGVGETTVYLPKGAAISAAASKGIGDIRVEGLENRAGMWVNPDANGQTVTVRLDVKGGVGEIHLIR